MWQKQRSLLKLCFNEICWLLLYSKLCLSRSTRVFALGDTEIIRCNFLVIYQISYVRGNLNIYFSDKKTNYSWKLLIPKANNQDHSLRVSHFQLIFNTYGSSVVNFLHVLNTSNNYQNILFYLKKWSKDCRLFLINV